MLETVDLQESMATEAITSKFRNGTLKIVYVVPHVFYVMAHAKVSELFPQILHMNVKSEEETPEDSPCPMPIKRWLATTSLAESEG